MTYRIWWAIYSDIWFPSTARSNLHRQTIYLSCIDTISIITWSSTKSQWGRARCSSNWPILLAGQEQVSFYINSDLLRNHLLSPRLGHHKMSQKVTYGHIQKFEVPLKCHTYRRLPSVSTYGSGVPLHCTFHVLPLKALPSKYSSTNSTRNSTKLSSDW